MWADFRRMDCRTITLPKIWQGKASHRIRVLIPKMRNELDVWPQALMRTKLKCYFQLDLLGRFTYGRFPINY